MEAAEASSPSAEGEIPLVAFLFVSGQSLAIVGGAKRSLFYCARGVKEKVADRFCCLKVCAVFLVTNLKKYRSDSETRKGGL